MKDGLVTIFIKHSSPQSIGLHSSKNIMKFVILASASCDLASKLTWNILSLKPSDGGKYVYHNMGTHTHIHTHIRA